MRPNADIDFVAGLQRLQLVRFNLNDVLSLTIFRGLPPDVDPNGGNHHNQNCLHR